LQACSMMAEMQLGDDSHIHMHTCTQHVHLYMESKEKALRAVYHGGMD
jgi:hypothetical protein